MSSYPPPESLRPGGAPADYGDDDDDWEPPVARGRDQDGRPVVIQLDRGGAYFSGPGVGPRTCRCGQQVITGSRADAQHVRECEPASAPQSGRGPGSPVAGPATGAAAPRQLVSLDEAAQPDVMHPGAISALYPGTTRAALRTARHRDKSFPAARGTRGKVYLYDLAELAAWSQARHARPDAAPETRRGGDRRSAEFQSKPINLKPGPTAERTVARLKRDDPELADWSQARHARPDADPAA